MWKSVLTSFVCLSLAAASSPYQTDLDLIRPLRTTADRIREHGYPAETHSITTPDGYELTMFRIPYSHNLNNQNDPNKPVVMLQHGLLSCSDAWLLNGPDDALGFMFADAGFDVYLGNARGNIYSRKHIAHSPLFSTFWKFGLHEIATVDVPAMIDYALALSQKDVLDYVGLSQGGGVLPILLAHRPEYNSKIHTAQLMAAPVYRGNITASLTVFLATLFGTPDTLQVKVMMNKEFLPQNPLISRVLDTLCNGNSLLPGLCSILLLMGGGNSGNMNQTVLPLVAETHPAGICTNQVIHTSQLQMSKEFRQFDYGVSENRQRFGQDTPPDYDLENISAPLYFYFGTEDTSAPVADGERLLGLVSSIVEFNIVEGFGHTDFGFHMQVREIINEPLIQKCLNHDDTRKQKR